VCSKFVANFIITECFIKFIIIVIFEAIKNVSWLIIMDDIIVIMI